MIQVFWFDEKQEKECGSCIVFNANDAFILAKALEKDNWLPVVVNCGITQTIPLSDYRENWEKLIALRNENIPANDLLEMACEFDLGPEPIVNGVFKWFEKCKEDKSYHVYVRNTGRGWAITQGNNCLRKDGKWEYSGLPSNRDEEFYGSHRYISADQAINYYRKWKDVIFKWVEKIKANPPEDWRRFKTGELVFEYYDCNEEGLKYVLY